VAAVLFLKKQLEDEALKSSGSSVVVAAAFLALAACSGQPDSGTRAIALVGAVLIDGTGAPPVADSTIVLKGDRIVAVGRTGTVNYLDTTEVVDVSGRWIIPGMIDAHIHLSTSGGLFSRPAVYDLSGIVSAEEEANSVRAREPYMLSRYLCSGVTSVVDLGGPSWIYDVRSTAESLEYAPRVFISGPFAQNGPVEAHFSTPDDPGVFHISTPDAARAFVRDLLTKDTDVVKTGFDSLFDKDLQQYVEKLAVLLDEGRQSELPVFVHAPELAITKAALVAGADRYAHTVIDRPLDDESLGVAVEHKAMFVSALSYPMGYRRVLTQAGELLDVERSCGDEETIASWSRLATLDAAPPLPLLAQYAEVIQQTVIQNVQRMRDAGLVVAVGSDAGNIGSLHGPAFHRELLLLEQAGMPPSEILVAATLNGARMLSMEDELGSIQVGKRADLLVLTANPAESAGNFSKIETVVSRGRVIDRARLLSDGARASQ
jgi:imidazolonepropionase-like amidohydrolase